VRTCSTCWSAPGLKKHACIRSACSVPLFQPSSIIRSRPSPERRRVRRTHPRFRAHPRGGASPFVSAASGPGRAPQFRPAPGAERVLLSHPRRTVALSSIRAPPGFVRYIPPPCSSRRSRLGGRTGGRYHGERCASHFPLTFRRTVVIFALEDYCVGSEHVHHFRRAQ